MHWMLNDASAIEVADKMNRDARKKLELLRTFTQLKSELYRRTCCFKFFLQPVKAHGRDRIEGIELARTVLTGNPFEQSACDSGAREMLECGLLFRSVGYRGRPIPGVPFGFAAGVLRNVAGCLVSDADIRQPGLYATGWIKRGATGIIGTNRADSIETVRTLVADLPLLELTDKLGAFGLETQLAAAKHNIVSYNGWQQIDQAEISAGRSKGKPREKMTRIDQMFAACSEEYGHAP